MGGGPAPLLLLQAFRPDPPDGPLGAIGREPARVDAIRRWWPKIKADIDKGTMPVVGLVRKSSSNPLELVGNHQVLAYGYDETPERIVIRIYDPNWPGRDDVELRASISPDVDRPWRDRIRLEQSTGEPLLGFFKHPYPKPDSLKAWREA